MPNRRRKIGTQEKLKLAIITGTFALLTTLMAYIFGIKPEVKSVPPAASSGGIVTIKDNVGPVVNGPNYGEIQNQSAYDAKEDIADTSTIVDSTVIRRK